MEDNRYYCKCGCNISIYSIGKHVKSQRHKDLLELNKNNDILINRCLKEKNDRIKLEIELSKLKREMNEKS